MEPQKKRIRTNIPKAAVCRSEIMAGDWSELQSDLLNLIGDILISSIIDYVRFRAVCKGWLSATPDLRHRQIPRQRPWLYDAPANSVGSSSNEARAGRSIVRITTGSGGGYGILCSCNGWFVVKRPSSELYIFNPLINVQVNIPSFPPCIDGDQEVTDISGGTRVTYPLAKYSRLQKLAMSGTPSTAQDRGGCVFLAILSRPRTLAALRGGDDAWNIVDEVYHYTDVTHVGGFFYAVDRYRRVFVFSNDAEKVATFGSPVLHANDSSWRLTESSGKLFLLRKVHHGVPIDGDESPPRYLFERVEIFSFDQEREPMFEEVKSLEGQMLLMGQGCSAFVPTKGHWGNRVFCLVEWHIRSFDKMICQNSGGAYDFGSRKLLATNLPLEGRWYLPTLY